MNHIEVKQILKRYYDKLLNEFKADMDSNGRLSYEEVEHLKGWSKTLDDMIQEDAHCISAIVDIPLEERYNFEQFDFAKNNPDSVHYDVTRALAHSNIDIQHGDDDYRLQVIFMLNI